MKIASFAPVLLKGKKGQHNGAKRIAYQTMEQAKSSTSTRRLFCCRVSRNINKVTCEKQSLAPHAGMYCYDTNGLLTTDAKMFCLRDVKVQMALSDKKPNKGVHVVGKGPDGKEIFLFAQVPARQAAVLSKKHGWWQKGLRKAFQIKPDIKCGKTRNGVNDRYIIFGWWKNPKDKEVGEYVFKQNAGEDDAEDVNSAIGEIVEVLEEVALPFTNPDDVARLKHLKQKQNIPSVYGKEGAATQFSVGIN